MKRSESQESRLQKLDPRLRGEEKKIKLKVCGMRDPNNIAELIQVQPDFIGFIFHSKSPRNVTEKLGIDIPDHIIPVGVFVEESEKFILQKAATYQLKAIQLHGYESPQFCEKLKASGLIVIKAFNIHKAFDFEMLKEYASYCDYFLFDAFGKNAGGNGITFNWQLLSNYLGETPFFLSGGIDETMALTINKISHPQFIGVDINSGFEMSPALKDIEKIKNFKLNLMN